MKSCELSNSVGTKTKKIARNTINLLGAQSLYTRYFQPLWFRYIEFTAPCVFVHIPKTAGTSLSSAMGMKGISHSTAKDWKNHIGSKKFESSFRFSVVRHPIDRVVSGYLWRLALYGVNNSEKNFNRDYTTPAVINKPDNINEIINEGLRESVKDRNWRETRLMKNYLYIDGTIGVDYVGKFEELDQVLETLEEKKLIKNAIPMLKMIDQKSKEKIILDCDVFDNLSEVLMEDFDIFGYKPEDTTYKINKA